MLLCGCATTAVERSSDPEQSQLGLCMLQLVGLVDRVSGVQ